MSLESLIRDQLVSNETLAGKLSKYNGAPAIFFGIAPDDTEPDWFKNQYPRIAYTITKQADNKRNTAGVMTMRVYCDSAGTHPEEIVSLLKETMSRRPSEMIKLFTLKAIERRLRFSDMTMQEIADDLNFPNASFFGKYVKEHLGMTPMEYRKKYQN